MQAWPWRHTTSPHLVYSDFAVIYNTSDVATNRVDVVRDLMEMPEKDPVR